MKILVAEDSSTMRFILTKKLMQWGYEVEACENGRQALAALQAGEHGLVITDWIMPEMDGLDFVREARAGDFGRYLYFIMLTSVSEKAQLVEALDNGVDDYVTKPFDEIELRARIKAGVRVVTLARELARRATEAEEALSTIRRLKELIPICMYCRRVRNDDDYWQQIEVYIHEQTGSELSHSICPDCYETRVVPEFGVQSRIPPGAKA